jgi:carbonic anhydrase/acetyltransferase-like protein (isoleucine patch superfamily)
MTTLLTLTHALHRRLRTLLGAPRFPGVFVAHNADIDVGRGAVHIAAGSQIAELALVSTKDGGTITLGERCDIQRGALLLAYGGTITLGCECSVNPYSILYGHGGLTIVDGVRIAAHTVIIPANHRFDDPERPLRHLSLSKKGIRIEDDVWIGTGVRVLDGVVIGRGAVVAAGAVVTRDVPPYSINAGVPSRVIGQRPRPAALHAGQNSS